MTVYPTNQYHFDSQRAKIRMVPRWFFYPTASKLTMILTCIPAFALSCCFKVDRVSHEIGPTILWCHVHSFRLFSLKLKVFVCVCVKLPLSLALTFHDFRGNITCTRYTVCLIARARKHVQPILKFEQSEEIIFDTAWKLQPFRHNQPRGTASGPKTLTHTVANGFSDT